MTKTTVSIVLAVLFAVAFLPYATGIALHELLGVAVFLGTTVHVVLNADWAVREMKRVFAPQALAERARALLNVSLAIAFATVFVSGLLISATVLPFFGYFAEGYFYWTWVHALAAKILLALLLVHLALRLPLLLRSIERAGVRK